MTETAERMSFPSEAERASAQTRRAVARLPLPGRLQGLLTLLLLVVIVPVVFAQSYLYFDRFQVRRDQELQANLELARAVGATFDAFVQDILHQELAIGLALTASPRPSPEQASALLASSVRAYPAIETYSWVDPDGRIIASTVPRAVGISVGDRGYYQAMVQGREWTVSEILEGRISAQVRFIVLRSIRDAEGQLLGTVAASVVPDRLGSVLRVERAGQGAVAIFDHLARVVYRYPEVNWTWEQRHGSVDDPLIRRGLSGEAVMGQNYSTADGSARITSVSPIRSIGWIAVSGRPEAEIVAPIIRDLGRQALVFLAVAVGAFAAALLVGRTLTVPVRRLEEHAHTIAAGKLATRVVIDGPSELRELAEAFNQMAAELQRREEERSRLLVSEQAARAEAEAAVRARDEFLSVAAHELRTPITGLRGYAQIAVRQLRQQGALDPDRAKQVFEAVDRQSMKIADLVGQLLDVSRIESGKLVLDHKSTDLVGLTEEVIRAARARTERHEIVFRASDSLPALVDPLRFEQVLVNVLDNAIKYSPDGGPINVELESVDVDWARVAIRDHGVGIPLERRDHIFDRFFQAHADGSFGGMGLGLYVSRQIVELHGGRLTVEFPDDGGTRFVIAVPVAEPQQPSHFPTRTGRDAPDRRNGKGGERVVAALPKLAGPPESLPQGPARFSK